jgi:hypothetical protein
MIKNMVKDTRRALSKLIRLHPSEGGMGTHDMRTIISILALIVKILALISNKVSKMLF